MIKFEMISYYISMIFIGIIIIYGVSAVPPYEHDINHLRRHLGTKTPYIAEPKPRVDTIGEKYNVLQFQMVSRHGTRYPSKGDCRDIAQVISHLQTSKNKEAVGWLENYKNVYPERRGKELDINGMREMYDYGYRMSHSHSNLINEILDKDVFLYYSSLASWSQRTSQSVIAFQRGLFENHQSNSNDNDDNLLDIDIKVDGHSILGSPSSSSGGYMQPVAPLQTISYENGTKVAQADICKRWKEQIEDNPKTKAEADKYKERYIGRIAARMTQELGIPMTVDDVESVYTGCQFDITHQHRVDTFCTLLDSKDIAVLEYHQDLESYYIHSYGSELNTKLACPLIQDIMKNMANAVNSTEGHTRMDIKYLHSESVFLTISFLGLFKDNQKLSADWSQQQVDERKFRCSKVSPFGGNVVFQLLSNKEDGSNKYVRVLVSEEAMVVPGCPDEICPYQTFKNLYQDKLQCSFEKLCNN